MLIQCLGLEPASNEQDPHKTRFLQKAAANKTCIEIPVKTAFKSKKYWNPFRYDAFVPNVIMTLTNESKTSQHLPNSWRHFLTFR